MFQMKQLGTSFFGRERRRPSIRPCLETLEERCLLHAGGGVIPTLGAQSTIGLVSDIDQANSSGNSVTIITLSPGTTFNFTMAYGGNNALPVITGQVLINGNGDTIEGTGVATWGKAFRLFDVAAGGSLTMQSLTLKDGVAMGLPAAPDALADGGAIYSSGGAVNLTNVIVESNKAVGTLGNGGTTGANAAGGGIYVVGGTLGLNDDLIKANEAVGSGGGSGYAGGKALGGGVYEKGGYVALASDTFIGNIALGGNGGNGGNVSGIGHNGGYGGAGGDALGGGLYVTEANSKFTGPNDYSNSSFNNNKAQGGNGGNGGNATGFAAGGNGGNGGNAHGGGLYVSDPFFTLRGCSISNNAAVGGNGGNTGAGGFNGVEGVVGGIGGSAFGGGVCATNSDIATLINTVISQDNTVTGGAPGPRSEGGLKSDPTMDGYAITLTPAQVLPSGTVGTTYATQTISAVTYSGSGTPTLHYFPPSSPLGLNFSASGNQLTINGTPTTAGTVTLDIFASGTGGTTATQVYVLTINPKPGGGGTGTGTGGGGSGTSGTAGGSGAGVGSGGSVTLNVPPLLAFFDSLLSGVETDANGTETITDYLFGFPLLVATFDSSGNLESVTLLGMNITSFFASL